MIESDARVLKMDRRTFLLVHVCLVTLTNTAFVPDSNTDIEVPEPPSVVCPDNCQCNTDLKTAQCWLANRGYSFDSLLPWKLQKLKILGDVDTLRQPHRYSSVKAVLKGYESNAQYSAENFNGIFSSLSYLEISYFPLVSITFNDLADFTGLKTLNLGYNNISDIRPKSFENQVTMEKLNLNGNNIHSLYDNVLFGLSKLTHLYLESNGLDFISSSAFSGLDSLKVLSLKSNNIRSLENFIGGLSHLSMLNLEGNKISYILNASVQVLSGLEEVAIGSNPFECSCVVKAFAEAVQVKDSTIQSRGVTCADPQNLENKELSILDLSDLPCEEPAVTIISEAMDIPYHTSVTLVCGANGTSPLGIFWLTPWGETFATSQVQRDFPELLSGAKSKSVMQGINLPIKSKVFVSGDNYLHLENFRGIFRGNFTCVAVGYMGVSNSTVQVDTYTFFPEIYMSSIFISVYCTCGLLTLAIIIGSIRWFVYKCLHSDGCHCCCCRSTDFDIEDKSDKSETLEVTYEPSEVCVTADESDDHDYDTQPPCPPVNSPQERLSPDKCQTPSEDLDPSKMSPHIWEQLDEVRGRLRDGAERKIEKVRSHVRSITDTGSLKIRNIKDASTMKIQSIRESGSHAASKVRKNVASGMVQVKYGVQSIKEFCGTGEMGTGTISMVSVSTDVDSTKQVTIVKSHTFV